MGFIGNAIIGKLWMDRQTNPRTRLSNRVQALPNLLVLGGTGGYAEELRAEAIIAAAQNCLQERWPALILSERPEITEQVLQLQNAMLMGVDVSYDPFAGCQNEMEAAHILEHILPHLSTQYTTANNAGAIQLARILMQTMVESHGEDALMLVNLDNLVISLEAHYDIFRALTWMKSKGYVVTENIKNALVQAWNNGSFTALSSVMAALRRAIRFMRRQDLEQLFSVEELLQNGNTVVIEIPRGDRQIALSVLFAELTAYIDHSRNQGGFVLLDYDVPLPACAHELFRYAEDTVLFCGVMRSLRLMSEPYMRMEDIFPMADTVVCLGLQNEVEAKQLADYVASARYVMMPQVNGDPGHHMGLSPMQTTDLMAKHLVSGQHRTRNIEDGGGAVFTPRSGAVQFYRNISFR